METTEIDPFAAAAGAFITDFPLLPENRRYRLIIKSPEKVKNDDGYERLKFKLTTTEDCTSTEGVKLHSGYGFTQSIGLTPKGDRDMESIKRDLATLLKAVEGPKTTTTFRSLLDNPMIIADKPVDADMKIRPAKGSFAASNEARFVVPKS